ncbi:PfkB family carbohydrate kinase [Microbacterium sp. ASV49]|uniref:PfkB family carbohydrate kinase n=1 Tax=Microbacterium candidum TaxID=3041922 RepID=A0ABT7MXS1_9MICO|nr:PfkB family carbohydrate kinase [Microbacterium sp. ASV49]MDL9979257.1 PfkB family carbohydrate kinase [Microbacterium sp. ASV49]
MTSSARVAVVGDNTVDRYLGGPEYVGGNALNVAVQLRLLDGAVTYFGAVGDDDDGRKIAGALRSRGVGTEGLVNRDGPTAVTEIRLTPEGDRVFVREEFGVTAGYRPSDAELARIAEHDWVHIGMLPHAADFVARLRRLAPDISISQDCAVSSGFAGLDVAFCSTGEDEQKALRAAGDALSGGAGLAVVTRGAEGALASDGRDDWRCTAVPVDVVDTTGAGDSFIAGFIAARRSGTPVLGALEAGARVAARTCGHVGGFPQ